ncbi:MAG TPA: hypothetical protein VIQ51_01820 [Chryseosolibacter sp.]|jgi:hypothetical protein
MKVDAKIFKGIEYVQVSELPQAQREILTKTINPDLYIKLLIDGKIIGGCLQYKDYSNWFQDHLQANPNPAREQSVVQEVEIKRDLALNKL